MASLSRRRLIHGFFAAGIQSVLFGALLPGCSPSAQNLQDSPSGTEAVAGLDPVRRRIICFAALAPSGHNSQLWKVMVEDPNHWILALDPDRRLPAVDPQNREAILSIGAFAESLILAAGAFGLSADIRPISQNPMETAVARVFLRPGPVVGTTNLVRLRRRRTLKNGMRPEPIADADLQRLAAPFAGRLHYVARNTNHADCIARGEAASFRAQTERDAAQAELARWVRFDAERARRLRDGLTPAGMEINGIAGWYARTFMSPKDVMGTTFRTKGIEITERLVKEGAGRLIVTSPSDGVADWLDAGRRFLRMAITAREVGTAIHPMTQQLEEDAWRTEIARTHGPKMIPQFILRVGYVNHYPNPMSPRRPIQAFVVRAA